MQTKERNERGGYGDTPVTSSGLGKDGSNFWWARKRKRLLAVYRLLNSLETVTPPSILLERGVTVSIITSQHQMGPFLNPRHWKVRFTV